MAFDNFIDKAKRAAAGVKEKVGDHSDKVGESILTVVGDLNDALPHLANAGYTMNELEIEVGLPPKIIPHFTVSDTLIGNREQSLTYLEGNAVGSALFKALLRATELQQNIVINGMDFSRIEIELGLLPAVRLSYKPMQEIN